jgi:hypothetical protein
MFRKILFATTALVVVQLSTSFAQPMQGFPVRDTAIVSFNDRPIDNKIDSLMVDANKKFLCDHGYKVTSDYYYRNSGSGNSELYISWVRVAMPITGRGRSVNTVLVAEGPDGNQRGPKFRVDIFTNTASGMPGHVIAHSRTRGARSCSLKEMSIPATFLKADKTYWLVEETPVRYQRTIYNVWDVRKHGTTTIMEQRHYEQFDDGSNYSSTTAWEPTFGMATPFAIVR